MQPIRPPTQPATSFEIPDNVEGFLVNAARAATPRPGYQVILPGARGEYYDQYEELVNGYYLQFGRPVTRDTFVNQQGERQSVRTNADLPDAQRALSSGFRQERAPGVAVTPFEGQGTLAPTGITRGAVSLAAPSGTFERFLTGQGRSPAQVQETLRGLNAAAMRQVTGLANDTDLRNLAYAESRGYQRPQVSQQAQVEAIRRIQEPPSAPSVTQPEPAVMGGTAPAPATPAAPAAPAATLPAGSFGEAPAAQPQRPPATDAQASSAAQAQQRALQDLMTAMQEAEAPTARERELLDLQNQLRNQDLSTQMGIAQVQDQPIAAPFLQGQSAAIQRQAGIRQQGIANQAAYLQSLIANEQASRQRRIQNAQLRYETASQMAQEEQRRNAPIEVNGSLVRVNPQTGQYEAVYQSPSARQAEVREVNGALYERQADGSWNLVAGAPRAAAASTPDVRNFEDGTTRQFNATTGAWDILARESARTGLTDPQRVSTFNSIVNNYSRSPLIAARDRTPVLERSITEIERNPNDAALQMNLAYSYIQALDTYQSAVREGELQNINSIDSMVGSLQNAITQLTNGQVVRPEVARQIASAAKIIVDTIKTAAEQKTRMYESQATVSGVGDEWSRFIQGARAQPVMPAPGQALTPTARPLQPRTLDQFIAEESRKRGMSIAPNTALYRQLQEQYTRDPAGLLGFNPGQQSPSTGTTVANAAGSGQAVSQTSRTGMRTDRHNNPTAFTTDIARVAGLREGVDYVAGDPFSNGQFRTARLLGDPIATTIRVIDNIGFYTQGGNQRWSHTAMPKSQWDKLTTEQKRQVIRDMYRKEGGTELRRIFA